MTSKPARLDAARFRTLGADYRCVVRHRPRLRRDPWVTATPGSRTASAHHRAWQPSRAPGYPMMI